VMQSLKGLNDITTTNISATAEVLDEALFSALCSPVEPRFVVHPRFDFAYFDR
jgi:hypothetical protein